MAELDSIFKGFYYDLCSVAKWIFVIRLASDVIKGAGNQDMEGIVRSAMNTTFAYGTIYSIVGILDKVEKAFR